MTPLPPSPAPTRRVRPWLVGAVCGLIIALLWGGLVLALRGSGNPEPVATWAAGALSPDGSLSASPSPSATLSAAPSPTPTGPRYHVTASLCDAVSPKPLGNWVTAKPQLEYGHPIVSGAGVPGSTQVACDFTSINSTSVTMCDYTVTAKAFASPADALTSFTESLTTDNGIFDRMLTGYGDQAYGGYHTGSNSPFYISGYEVVVLKLNLVLDVDVDYYQAPGYLTKQAMLPRVGALAKATLGVVKPS